MTNSENVAADVDAREVVFRAVEWVKYGAYDEALQAAVALRALASDLANKEAIQASGGMEALMQLVAEGPGSELAVVATEAVSCLVAGDATNRDLLRRTDGINLLVRLLTGGPESEATHRALLALRILTDKEQDRLAILHAGGVPLLVGLLEAGPDSEITEHAAAALSNVAAGSQGLKNAIREAGGVPPLVALIRDTPDEISAELAAVALRNLALHNPANREAIQIAGGQAPLLNLLAIGQDKLEQTCRCRMVYMDTAAAGPQPDEAAAVEVQSVCSFDPRYAHLCIAKPSPRKPRTAHARGSSGFFSCFSAPPAEAEHDDRQPPPLRHGLHKDVSNRVERYSMLRKLTITEPDGQALHISFLPADPRGVVRLQDASKAEPSLRLSSITIYATNTTEVKGAIMRMLTRMHLMREFRQHQLETGASFGGMSGAAGLYTTGSARVALPPFPPNAAFAAGGHPATTLSPIYPALAHPLYTSPGSAHAHATLLTAACIPGQAPGSFPAAAAQLPEQLASGLEAVPAAEAQAALPRGEPGATRTSGSAGSGPAQHSAAPSLIPTTHSSPSSVHPADAPSPAQAAGAAALRLADEELEAPGAVSKRSTPPPAGCDNLVLPEDPDLLKEGVRVVLNSIEMSAPPLLSS